MKFINIIGSSIVLLSNIYVSFNHTIMLFQLGGFTGNIALAGVIGAETTFLLGVLNVTVAKLKGEKAGVPAYAGFYLGVSLILWSNIHAGLNYGITGIILGAIIPVSLIIAEAIIGRAILHTTPTTPVVEEQKDDPLLQVALDLYQKNGKIPSRRSFMETAKATEWQARKTIDSLRAMV